MVDFQGGETWWRNGYKPMIFATKFTVSTSVASKRKKTAAP
jgi:hypothetical protein